MEWTACQCFRRQTTQNTSWLLPMQMEYRHLKVLAINKSCLWAVVPPLGHRSVFFNSLSTSLCRWLSVSIHMKACAGWRWSYTAMCSSMLLVSTNVDCFDTSRRPSAAIKQIGFAHAKLRSDIHLLFQGKVSVPERERANLMQTCNFRIREGNWRLKMTKTHPGTDWVLCWNVQD